MKPSNLKTKYMTRNDCYTAGRKITPKGIMVHSTATPGVMAADWFSRWNKSYKVGEINHQACVHAFVDDKEIWQHLPWNHRGWHAGGKANDTHIGIELCEPGGFSYSGSTMVGYDVKKNEAYFRAAWKNAVDLCIFLCKQYGLTEKYILGHAEGHRQGIASNHADPLHWYPKHGESMDTFRTAVKAALNQSENKNGLKIAVGDVVEIRASATRYFPSGPLIPPWVKDTYHEVTQITASGKEVYKGGKCCVLLGKKVHKLTGNVSAGIMTWVDIDELNLISSKVKEPITTDSTRKFYRVQVGAFGNRENAEKLMKELIWAGFNAYVKYE
ncbi:N-acetylmuramoyl-L-alanine amidase [Syntrophomonas erecta]